MLVKKCIFSFSRKKNSITFTDIVANLQTYYLYGEKRCLILMYFEEVIELETIFNLVSIINLFSSPTRMNV